jgi:hypothetical protein
MRRRCGDWEGVGGLNEGLSWIREEGRFRFYSRGLGREGDVSEVTSNGLFNLDRYTLSTKISFQSPLIAF